MLNDLKKNKNIKANPLVLTRFSHAQRGFKIINRFILAKHGFTIIELLVVLSIMMILSGIGFAGFYTYSRSQAVEQTAQDIKLQIEKAKFSALSQVKPESCSDSTTLTGYRFRISGNTYIVAAYCSGVEQDIEVNNLPSNLIFSSGGGCTVTFGTQTNDVVVNSSLSCGSPTSGNVAKIVLTGFTFSKTINVDSGGNVSIQ